MKRGTMVMVLLMVFIYNMGFGLSQPAAEQRWAFYDGKEYVDIGIRAGYLKGDSTYHISFDGGASELEFPLRVFLLGPEIGLGYKNTKNQEKLRLNLIWLTSITEGTGKMKDSDWIDGDGQPGLDIYSESDIELKANIFHINLLYNFWPTKNISIGPVVGYKYQQFKYDISNTDQVGYGIYAPFTASPRGRTLEYKAIYHIPYFGLNSGILFLERFQANIKLGYAPWAFAKDRDDHLLRYKLSRGDTDGYAYFANLNADWNFWPHLYLTISGEYMKIRTTGTQHQSFYAGPFVGTTYDVDDKITSKQWLISAMITCRF